MGEDSITRTIDKMLKTIVDTPQGLDASVLAEWYDIIVDEAKSRCPTELRGSISVIQDPILPMKFHFNMSRRVVKYVVEAVENNLPKMPFATRLYFQKIEEIIEEECIKPPSEAPSS